MVYKCCMCGEKALKNCQYSFHRFPKDERRHKWLEACNLDDDRNTDSMRVCSKHFLVDDFNERSFPQRVLLDTAIPCPTITTKLTTKKQKVMLDRAGPSTSKEEGLFIVPSFPQATATESTPSTSKVEVISIVSSHARATATESTPSTSKVEVLSIVSSHPHATATESTPSKVKQQTTTLGPATETTPSKVKPDARYPGDVQVVHFSTPRKAARHLHMLKSTIRKHKDTIRSLRKYNKRLQDRVKSFHLLLQHLRDINLLNEETASVIMESTPSTMQNILARQLCTKNRKYLPEIRSFALSLHFHSAAAYDYVRQQFNNLLPHPATIRQWYTVVDGSPGFTQQSFEAIKAKQSNESVILNLTVDEMSIRKMIEFRNGRYYGYIEHGTKVHGDGDSMVEAKNALVFMAVAINGHWKVPLGYFLIDGLSAKQRADLLVTCLELLYETGAQCNSLTFDGTAVNISMVTTLGASYMLDIPNKFRPYFIHKNTGEKVHTILDACHMLKLVRNTLGERKQLYNAAGECIQWEYIVHLYNLQKAEGLKAGTKLTANHINFENQKMKVRLAAQVLSHSVSSALLFCRNIGLKEFENCEATAEFCLIINNIFGVLNSRNTYAKVELNRPISPSNILKIREHVAEYINYLKNLKDGNGTLLILSNRKTGFLGFIVGLTSTLSLYDHLIEKKYIKYLLTYKLSQDHLETFFSAIRRRGGWNNNPSSLQFQSAYRRLLVRSHIQASSHANCNVLDATLILTIGAGTNSKIADSITDEEDEDNIINEIEMDHDYINMSLDLSRYVSGIVEYISGYVAKKVHDYIKCATCKSFLWLNSDNISSPLIKEKQWGKLHVASRDVTLICKTLEKLIREHKNVMYSKDRLIHWFTTKLMRRQDFFEDVNMLNHIKQQDVEENHRVQLIKFIANYYLKVRLYHEAKEKSQDMQKKQLRQKYTKLILFQNM